MRYAHSTRTSFGDMLGTLDHLVDKTMEAGLSDDVLAAKLTEDMFPLELQFRVALNQILLALNQVGGQTLPLEEESYASLGEIKERIAAVRAYLDAADPADWAPGDAEIDLTLPNGVRFLMSTKEYLRDWILPNFYFHMTMAYALLRHAGLSVGKMDFLPHMRRYMVAAGES